MRAGIIDAMADIDAIGLLAVARQLAREGTNTTATQEAAIAVILAEEGTSHDDFRREAFRDIGCAEGEELKAAG